VRSINSQIQQQLYASYVSLSMAFYCDHDDMALRNFTGFFLHLSEEWKAGYLTDLCKMGR
jgi:ferritin